MTPAVKQWCYMAKNEEHEAQSFLNGKQWHARAFHGRNWNFVFDKFENLAVHLSPPAF